ncbi:MAG TPA: hypothetical protein VHO72_12760 [Bacteroidales bacterium]|nr:hypothetical protein [Bacteroidales bacterium]
MKYIATILFSLISISAFSQIKNSDTLIYLNEIKFNSAEEELHIRNFFEKKGYELFRAIFLCTEEQLRVIHANLAGAL